MGRSTRASRPGNGTPSTLQRVSSRRSHRREYEMDKQYKLILFDYNGTLVNTPFVDKNPLHILPGRREKLAELRSQGIFLGVCTNQAGPLWHMATSQDKFPSALYV